MTKPLVSRVKTAIALTLVGLWAERVLRAFWPMMTIVLGLVGGLAFASPNDWPIELLWMTTMGVAAAAVWAAFYAYRNFHLPTRVQALHRVDAHMADQPLAGLLDKPALGAGDATSQALWQLHRQRMADQAQSAQYVTPDTRIAQYDPFALRYVAVICAILGLLFGSFSQLRTDGFGGRAEPGILPPNWEGWITPPAYTRKPTVYLNDFVGQAVNVPQGSRVSMRLYGDAGDLIVTETVSARIDGLTSAADPQQDFTISQSGDLAVAGPHGGKWSIVMSPDNRPQISPQSDLERDDQGRFSIGFAARDDYGVTGGHAIVRLDLDAVDRRYGLAADPADLAPVELPIPTPVAGQRTEFNDIVVEDFAKHVWAHLPVSVSFVATDHMGQQGVFSSVRGILPARRFFDPVAKALVELRRDILWSPDNLKRTSQVLRAVRFQPTSVFRDATDATTLETIITDMDAAIPRAPDADVLADLGERLWDLAVKIEDGDLKSAAEALARAQEKLAEAIRNGASQDDIQRLIQELRQAQQDYMQEFAERHQGEAGPQDQNGGSDSDTEVTPDQLQEMMDRLQHLMEEGRMAEAQELLEEINRLMENLQMREGQQGGQGQNGQGQGGQDQNGGKGEHPIDDLTDTLREQRDLSDDAFRELQDQSPPTPNGQQGQPQGENQGQGQEQGQTGDTLAERQSRLRDLLDQQRRNLPGAGTDPGEDARDRLDDADRAMKDAEENLNRGDLPGALDDQSRAIDALRQAMRDLGRALAQERGDQQGPQADETQAENSQPLNDGPQSDPLGRSVQDGPHNGSGDDMIGQEDLRQRTQDLMDEIQRRSSQLDKPKSERDYLKRLLEFLH